MLLMEFHGSPAGVKEQAETVQELASGHGGKAFEWASTPEERTRLWTARHNSYFAAVQSRPGCRVISTDTCVPISRLADCLLESVAEADASGIPYFLVGHVGDGNFHFGYLLDPNAPEERVTAEKLNHALVSRALALEGTCTGEHGVGLHKMGFLVDRGRRRRDRHDAHHQACARPEEHHESGEDLQSLKAPRQKPGARKEAGLSCAPTELRRFLSRITCGAPAPARRVPRSAKVPRRHRRPAGRRRPGPGLAPSAPCSCAARRPSG